MGEWPFTDWLRLAVHVFKLSPEQFWAMSVQDWMRLSAAQKQQLGRAQFDALLAQFPDEQTYKDVP